jgi:hypothetical protein
MSAENPPTYNFSGIDFNPSFYVDESNSSGITQEQANALYLQKTIPDTATALETFSAGISATTVSATGDLSGANVTASNIITGATVDCTIIKTNTYQSKSINQPLTLGNNQTSIDARMDIGNNIGRNANINIATIQTTGTGNIVIGSTAITGAGSQNITINRPITIGYTPAKLTNFNQIGYYDFSIGSSSGTITSAHNYLVHSVTSVPDGTYIIIGNITCLGTGCTITLQEFGITTVSPPIPTGALTYYPGASVKTSNTFNPLNGTYIVNFSTVCQIMGGTIYLSQNTTYTGGTYSVQGKIIITRIG